MRTEDLPLFHVCFPEWDPETWYEKRACDASDAAIDEAERQCNEDAGNYRAFADGMAALVREDGASLIQRFEVTVESVPVFSATATGKCGAR